MNWKRRFPNESIFYETDNGLLYLFRRYKGVSEIAKG